MSISPLFPRDFPEYDDAQRAKMHRSSTYGKTPAPTPAPTQDGQARIHARMDQTILANMMLNHLWLVNSKRCACGMRSDQTAGKHYVWWTDHVASLMVAAGFSAGWDVR